MNHCDVWELAPHNGVAKKKQGSNVQGLGKGSAAPEIGAFKISLNPLKKNITRFRGHGCQLLGFVNMMTCTCTFFLSLLYKKKIPHSLGGKGLI